MVKKVNDFEHLNIYRYHISFTFLTPEKEAEFKKNNSVILDTAQKIDNYVLGYYQIAIITIICCCSMFLNLSSYYRQLNSLLLILPKGSGKSLFLNILAKSNIVLFQVLPKKMFESLLLKNGSQYFNNKILVHADLITALFGLSNKQRQQLLSFWTELLSDCEYSREGTSISGSCLVIFGIASENYELHRAELIDVTFSDRVMPLKKEITREEEEKILSSIEDKPIPKIKIPFPKKKQKINLILTDVQKIKINEYAMKLRDYGIMSSIRAKKFIEIFLMANACFNVRKATNEYDFILFESIYPLFLNSSDVSHKLNQISSVIQKYPTAKDSELIEILSWSKPTFYKYKKIWGRLHDGEK